MKKDRYIAVADILGFKSLIETIGLDELVGKVKQLNELTKSPFMVLNKDHENREDIILRKNGQYEEIEHLERTTYYTLFSDTFLFYSDQDSPEEVEIFLLRISQILVESIRLGLPLRIGVAFGESYIDKENDYYVGKAISDAYLLEQNQNWIGCSVHETVYERENFNDDFKRNALSKFSDHYKSPLNNSLALKWTLVIDNDHIEAIMSSFLNPMHETVFTKWFNTLKFIELESDFQYRPRCLVGKNDPESYLSYARHNSIKEEKSLIDYLESEIEPNIALAKFHLAEYFLQNNELDKALLYYKESFDLGLGRAGNKYVALRAEQEGDQVYPENIGILREAKNSDPILSFKTGGNLFMGIRGFKRDYELSYEFIRKAFISKDYLSLSLLIPMYAEGMGIEKNKEVSNQLRILEKEFVKRPRPKVYVYNNSLTAAKRQMLAIV